MIVQTDCRIYILIENIFFYLDKYIIIFYQIKYFSDFGSGLVLVTADYSPAAKWNPDYDGLFTVRITSPNIKKTNELSFFITLSRFGQVKQLGIGTNIHGPLQRVGPGPKMVLGFLQTILFRFKL